VSYELHPETPPAGTLLSERFKGMDLAPFYANLRARGNELGIVFNEHKLLSNSRMALLASEYARDMGRYDEFHENIFKAYMTEAQDIGRPEVIAAMAEKSGLDADATLAAVQDDRYALRLTEAAKEGRMLGLTGIPLFIVNNQYKIVGAQPLEIFRNFLDKMK
jgi:predicted DsbA family dithiol-disulfide isomerase